MALEQNSDRLDATALVTLEHPERERYSIAAGFEPADPAPEHEESD
jgi:hypothetical protein